jgi:hypothetical protein
VDVFVEDANIEEAKKIIVAMKEGKLEVKDDLTYPGEEVDPADAN